MTDSSMLFEHLQEALDSDSESGFQQALQLVLAHFDCVVGTVHRHSADSKTLHLVAEQGIPAAIREQVTTIPVGKGMAGLAAERRAPVQVCNLQTDTSGDVRPGAKTTEMEGAVTLPILDGDTLLGTFGIAKPQKYEFTEEEIATLEGAARTMVPFLRE